MTRFWTKTKAIVVVGVFLALVVAPCVVGGAVQAAPSSPTNVIVCDGSGNACDKRCAPSTFFTLVPWYKYLNVQLNQFADKTANDYCEPVFRLLRDQDGPSSIPFVLLALLDNLVRIAALVAVGYIIYGGIKYMLSRGSPEGTNQAQQTIINALIGMVIALAAVALVSFIGNRVRG